MRRNSRLWRNLTCALVAAAFALAVQPGAMAMPAPRKAAPMTNMDHGTPACDQINHQQERSAPCKNMPFCFGMLSCYGMAVVLAVDTPVLLKTAGYRPAPQLTIAAPGLTHPPENRPPIA